MAKNIYISLTLLFLLATFYSSSQSGNLVIDTALSQIGVREATGKNDGTQVEKYLKSCNLGKGYAWCAAFITWCYQVNKVKAKTTAWAPAWFTPASKVIYTRANGGLQPKRGDVFGLWINNRIGHVGFIYKWDAKFVTTIEGNTNEAGSREGDGVYKKKRLTKQVHIVSRWQN